MSDWTPRATADDDANDVERSITVAALFINLEDQLFPREPTLLERHAGGLRLSGAAALGCLAATLSIFFVHIVLTLLFHYQPS